MDALPSTEFRKRFSRLTEPTTVTVNGHPIGVWTPGVPWSIVTEGIAAATQLHEVSLVHTDATPGEMDEFGAHAFSTRPFSPAPKPSKR